eukprot:771578-Pyramimonas_sp.AAC.1
MLPKTDRDTYPPSTTIPVVKTGSWVECRQGRGFARGPQLPLATPPPPPRWPPDAATGNARH